MGGGGSTPNPNLLSDVFVEGWDPSYISSALENHNFERYSFLFLRNIGFEPIREIEMNKFWCKITYLYGLTLTLF